MRLKSSVLAFCLAVGLCGAQASAMTVNTNAIGVESVQPRAAQCGKCGAYMLTASTSFGAWVDTGATAQCSKYATKRDVVQSRVVYTTYDCRSCGYHQVATGSQTRIYCSH